MSSSSESVKKRVPHLPFLDGLRGLAALYVVLFHCQMILALYMAPLAMPGWVEALIGLIKNGHSSVCIFIALSGYVLMLPVLFSEDGRTMVGGPVNFMKRRGRRIFPPYYAALVLFGVIAFFKQSLPSQADFGHLTVAAVIAHVFLVHNLSAATIFQIDPPMWSLATEWQIYIVFAALLIPLSRRIGLGWTLLATGLLSLCPHFFLPEPFKIDQACPWFLILFQFGAIAAWFTYSAQESAANLRKKLPWGWLAAGTYAVWLLLQYQAPFLPSALRRIHEGAEWSWLLDTICGLAVAFLLVALGRSAQKDRSAGSSAGKSVSDFLAAILQSRFAVTLGAFSYSLYLVHQPIIEAVVQLLRAKRLHLPEVYIWVLLPVIAIPVAMAVGYAFYCLLERPFLRSRTRPGTSRQ